MPKVILMRGIPGSGKSSLVNKYYSSLVHIMRQNVASDINYINKNIYISTDDYWYTPEGEYVFDPSRLSHAHKSTFTEYQKAINASGDFTVILDNTNINLLDVAPYVVTALSQGLPLEVWTCISSFEQCVARQTHNVPFETVRGMYSAFMNTPWPSYWPAQNVFMTT